MENFTLAKLEGIFDRLERERSQMDDRLKRERSQMDDRLEKERSQMDDRLEKERSQMDDQTWLVEYIACSMAFYNIKLKTADPLELKNLRDTIATASALYSSRYGDE
jgi:hypothetical protein